MATITINQTISAIKTTNAVVNGLNPLPLCVTLDTLDEQCFLTLQNVDADTSPDTVKETIVSGLQMLQIDEYNFVVDLQTLIERALLENLTNLPTFYVTIQAQKAGVVDALDFYFYAVPHTTQFPNAVQLGEFTDVDILTKLNDGLTLNAFTNKNFTLYEYAKTTKNLVRNSYTGVKLSAGTYNDYGWTIKVQDACTDDLILSFLNSRYQRKFINLGRYYTERIEQGETTKVLLPYVNTAYTQSDTMNVRVQGTKKINVTLKNVGRTEMALLKDLYTSNSVLMSYGATNYDIRVDVAINADIFSTKQPFTDIPIEITLPKYYTI